MCLKWWSTEDVSIALELTRTNLTSVESLNKKLKNQMESVQQHVFEINLHT